MKNKIIHTQHGELQAPFFMPDATRAEVRALPTEHIAQAGIESLCVITI